MFSLFGGYGGLYDGYGYGDGGVDRRGWADKSEAAQRREDQATRLFHNFITKAKTQSTFPYTQIVVPPEVHLTSACWSSFRKAVVEEGYVVKRREASIAEKTALKPGERRNGKMYVVSITAPVHPDHVREAKDKKEEKARNAKAKREEKAREKKEREEEEKRQAAQVEKELKERTEHEYDQVIAMMKLSESNQEDMETDTEDEDGGVTNIKKEAKKEEDDTNDKKRKASSTENDTESSPTKRIKSDPVVADATPKDVKITVPLERMFNYAQSQHEKNVRDICSGIRKEEQEEKSRLIREIEQRFSAKQDRLIKNAVEKRDSIKTVISNAHAATITAGPSSSSK